MNETTFLENEPDVAPHNATEPPKRWQNWFVALREHGFQNHPGFVDAGEKFHGTHTWPSKDTAESAFQEDCDSHPWMMEFDEYLGAYPVDDQP